ncbi:MAG: YkgJ family cysteine cluster protein [Bacillota bacterium]
MISPEKLKEASEKVEKDNMILRSFLKGRDEKEVDDLFNTLHKQLFEEIDCLQCMNCCKEMTIPLREKDITNISSKLGLSRKEFKAKYLEKAEEGFKTKEKPCPFLEDYGCSIYESRPKDCREYPYTHKKEINFRLLNLVISCDICPVVFEIFEKVKEYYHDEFIAYKKEFQLMEDYKDFMNGN